MFFSTVKSEILQQLKIQDVFASNIPRRMCDLQGWNSSDPLLIESIEPLEKFVAIEVGAWKGLSTIAIARAIKQNWREKETAVSVGGGSNCGRYFFRKCGALHFRESE